MKKYILLVAALVLQGAFLNVAFADNADQKGKVIEKPVAADTPEKFAQTAAQVRTDMAPGGRYEFIRPEEKAKADADLAKMADLLQKSGSVSAMPQADKLQLFNAQEQLNGILTRNDKNRLVCERNTAVGTHIPVTSCKTVGEIERQRHDAQKTMQDSQMIGSKCSGTGCRGG